ncbi:MAG TPA: hypothetical protein VHA07_05830 [Devosia sp.]|nr:hypothetical protein [Devosia sp.]
MIALVERFLDRITMYRLVFWYLAVLLGAALALGAVKAIAIDPVSLLLSLVLVLASGYLANQLFARIFGAIPNVESVYITGMIIVLIMQPPAATDLAAVGAVVAASVWAMASKFLLSARRRHIFNPAALGVALPALALNEPGTWWVSAQPWLLPIVVVGGLLILRKLRRFDLFLAFAAANLAVTILTGDAADALGSVKLALMDSPFLFFGFVMLTEPLTAPQHKMWRLVYAALVGALASPNTAIAGYYFTPEVALLVGNLFTLLVSPEGRVVLTLRRIEQAAQGAYDFVFQPDRPLAFAAGQYLEWTLPVDRPDGRGNRRYFTIASAPTEDEVRLGVKFAANGSAFKRALADLRPGQRIVASQLAGSFTLPRNRKRKLCFIAGGIGITPFRSMLRELLDRNERRDIVVLYGSGSAREVAYADLLAEAETELGIRTHIAVLDPTGAPDDMRAGFIDEAMVRETVPDFAARTFYLSGPMPMVTSLRQVLRGMGVHPWQIRTDFFPGLA